MCIYHRDEWRLSLYFFFPMNMYMATCGIQLHGIRIYQKSSSPLIFAIFISFFLRFCQHGKWLQYHQRLFWFFRLVGMIKEMRSKGVNFNVRLPPYNMTVLHLAVKAQDKKILTYLIKNSIARINDVDDMVSVPVFRPPLHWNFLFHSSFCDVCDFSWKLLQFINPRINKSTWFTY